MNTPARMFVIVALSFAAFAPELTAQCAMCGEAVEDSARSDGGDSQGSLAAGLYWSILFMLGVVLSIGAGLAVFIARVARAESLSGVAAVAQGSAAAGDPPPARP